MARPHKSRYVPRFPEKYDGDPRKIICRSNWERNVCQWLDAHPAVVKWSSERVPIPYRYLVDGPGARPRTYFPDFKIVFQSGRVLIVEIKPESQTRKPSGVVKNAAYIKRLLAWQKNLDKWKQASKFCEKNGWIFQVWTERLLCEMAIIPRK